MPFNTFFNDVRKVAARLTVSPCDATQKAAMPCTVSRLSVCLFFFSDPKMRDFQWPLNVIQGVLCWLWRRMRSLSTFCTIWHVGLSIFTAASRGSPFDSTACLYCWYLIQEVKVIAVAIAQGRHTPKCWGGPKPSLHFFSLSPLYLSFSSPFLSSSHPSLPLKLK